MWYKRAKWTKKYKRSIDCSHPKGFSQRAHCQGRKKRKTTKRASVASMGTDSYASEQVEKIDIKTTCRASNFCNRGNLSKIAARYMPMPSSMTYTDIGHNDNDKVIFWVYHGGRIQTAIGKGDELHSDKFPDIPDWGPSGRVIPDKGIGSLSFFPKNHLQTELFKQHLERTFPNVRTFFVNKMSSYDVDDIDF